VAGNELVRPAALVVLAGLVTSTLVNLLVVPAAWAQVGAGPRGRRTRARPASVAATAALLLSLLLLSGCGGATRPSAEPAPASVDAEDTDTPRVVLSAEAAHRLGIETAVVRTVRAGRAIPDAALLYDERGGTFVFTNPRPLLYVRTRVQIGRQLGALDVLTRGPPAGVRVVTVGVQELLGIEDGVQE
jgi:hypothetical protein